MNEAPRARETAAPSAEWRAGTGAGTGADTGAGADGEGAWTLALAGDWRQPQRSLPAPPTALAGAGANVVAIDARRLDAWDLAFAASLWQMLRSLPRVRVKLDELPRALRRLLELALPAAAAAAAPGAPDSASARLGAGRSAGSSAGTTAPAPRTPLAWLAFIGTHTRAAGVRARTTLTFIGEVLLAFARLLVGRSRMQRRDLLWHLEQCGPRSAPIVALVSALSGLILGYMGAAQLQRFGAQSFIADLVTVGAVREMAALMTGVILAGRIGAAYAAQLGSMQANEEIDAVRVLGVDPIELLVLPRVLAMLLMAPLLIAYAALITMLAGGSVAVWVFHVPANEYLFKSLQALTLPHLMIGLFKGTVYALLVALAGCRQGLAAGRSAQAVGDATTTAVVQAIVWMVAAASVLTVAFQKLGW